MANTPKSEVTLTPADLESLIQDAEKVLEEVVKNERAKLAKAKEEGSPESPEGSASASPTGEGAPEGSASAAPMAPAAAPAAAPVDAAPAAPAPDAAPPAPAPGAP